MQAQVKITLSKPRTKTQGTNFSLRMSSMMLKSSASNSRPERIFISGFMDDFEQLITLLYNNRVINGKMQWIYGGNHLVIIGNIPNNQPELINALWFLYGLELRASQFGGKVHFLKNIETSQSEPRWRFEHPTYGDKKNLTALYDGNNTIYHWLMKKTGLVRIGDAVFLHPQVLLNLADGALDIMELQNQLLYGRLLKHESKLQVLLAEQQLNTERVTQILKALHAKHLVTSETTCGDLLLANGHIVNVPQVVDVQRPAGLLVKRGRFYLATDLGRGKRLFD